MLIPVFYGPLRGVGVSGNAKLNTRKLKVRITLATKLRGEARELHAIASRLERQAAELENQRE